MSRAYPSREGIGFVSSGNPIEDERIAEGIILHERRLAEGICANGCGPMTVTSRWDADCPKCGFHWSCTSPHNLPTERPS